MGSLKRGILFAGGAGCLVLGGVLWQAGQHLALSFLVLAAVLAGFHACFERRPARAEEIVLIASLAALAAAGRIPFAAIPGVQPTSFVVILSGMALGPLPGGMIGSVAAFVSNAFLGQGPWTPWQMLAWGAMGASAGWLGRRGLLDRPPVLWGFGMLWGFWFGWIMNAWVAVSLFGGITREAVGTTVAASFFFDLSHGVTNTVLLVLFATRWRKLLQRVVRKYGLLDSSGETREPGCNASDW